MSLIGRFEFIAYQRLAEIPLQGLSPRSRVIATDALCGFANFGSVGVPLGGLGLRAMVAGGRWQPS